MIKYALYQYVPARLQRRASFEEQNLCRMILGFKDGRNVYSRWAARKMAYALSLTDLSDTAIVCIPASTPCANVRRWKRFSHLLCSLTGGVDGFQHVRVSGSRKRAHVTGEYELATNIKHFVDLDADFFRDQKVVVIDDIYTTGRSSSAFIGALEDVGAHVILALFLAKTRCYLSKC